MNMKKYENNRQQLILLRDELEGRYAAIQKDVRHEESPLDSDFEEQAVENQNEQVLDTLSEEARQQLALIDAALERLDNGSYGRCVECGNDIGDERLAAVPYADRCIDCAETA
jgi:DnaK suppressor protein